MDRVSLDQIDQRILAELTKNARMSHAELATKVLLSRNAVRQRIERMERIRDERIRQVAGHGQQPSRNGRQVAGHGQQPTGTGGG